MARARFLGLDLMSPAGLLLIQQDPTDKAPPDWRRETSGPEFAAAHSCLIRAVSRALQRRGIRGVVVPEGDGLVVLVSIGQEHAQEDLMRLAETVRRDAGRALGRTTLSIAVGGVCLELGDFGRAYHDARRALRVARSLGRKEQVISLEELGIYGMLLQDYAQPQLSGFLEKTLGQLVRYDQKHGASLVETLRAYLLSGGSIPRACETMYVHRNTLKYRLERIQEIAEVDLDDPETRLQLQVALKVRELMEADKATS